MNESCDRWLGWTSADQHHLRICDSCSEQWRAHQMLEDLATLPRPELDSSFASRTRRRAETSRSSQILSPGRRLFMRGYWLSTSLVVFMVVLQLASAARGLTGPILCLCALALVSLPAVSLLHRLCRWDLIDLLAWTTR
jgi:hypothetical protein